MLNRIIFIEQLRWKKALADCFGKNQQYKQIRLKLAALYTFWNPWVFIFVFFGGAKTVRKTSVGKNLRCKKWCCTVLIIHKSASWTMIHDSFKTIINRSSILKILTDPIAVGNPIYKTRVPCDHYNNQRDFEQMTNNIFQNSHS